MSTRVKYTKKNTVGVIRSVQTFKSNKGATYRIKIDTIELYYYIMNINENRTTKKGGDNINSLRVLKREAKRALQKLGVQFELELRDI